MSAAAVVIGALKIKTDAAIYKADNKSHLRCDIHLEKIRLNISCESSALVDKLHEMSSLIFSRKKNLKNRLSSATIVRGILKVKNLKYEPDKVIILKVIKFCEMQVAVIGLRQSKDFFILIKYR